MATRNLTLTIAEKPFTTELAKITREDLYGETRVKVQNTAGEELHEAMVPAEGDRILTSDMLGRSTLIGEDFTCAPVKSVDALTGNAREEQPSSFDEAPQFTEGKPEDVLSLQLASIYHLPGVSLDPGKIFTGNFNYRTGLVLNAAVIVSNAQGAFMLVGQKVNAGFVGMEEASEIIAAAETAEADEDFFSAMA